MVMKNVMAIILFLLWGTLYSEKLPLTVVTENFKPYNYLDENDSLVGPSVEITRNLLKRCGYEKLSIQVYPWARSYALALDGKNVLIFSMVRTPDRDSLFIWIGEVAKMNMGVIRLKKNDHLKVTSLDDLANYSMATFIDSPFDSYFTKRGMPIKNRVGNYLSITRLLVEGRVEFVPASIEGFLSSAENMGYPRDLFEVALPIPELDKGLWIALSKGSDEELVSLLKREFEKMQTTPKP